MNDTIQNELSTYDGMTQEEKSVASMEGWMAYQANWDMLHAIHAEVDGRIQKNNDALTQLLERHEEGFIG